MKDHMNKDELNQQPQNLDNKVKFLIDKGVSIKKRSHFNLLVILFLHASLCTISNPKITPSHFIFQVVHLRQPG